MNERGLNLLAAELEERIRKKTIEQLTARLHVHVKGMPRKQEIKELHRSEQFITELEKALAEDPP